MSGQQMHGKNINATLPEVLLNATQMGKGILFTREVKEAADGAKGRIEWSGIQSKVSHVSPQHIGLNSTSSELPAQVG
jgi:hypothetical protein